jgi:predicted DNA binding protein
MVLQDLDANKTVESIDLDIIEPGSLHGAVTTSVCLGCCTMVSSETFLVDVKMDKDGLIHQRIISKDRESVRQAIEKVEALGHTVNLEKLNTLDASSYLTSHQEEILQIAYEKGYFDQPKRTDLKELSEFFGISISTMSEILRKAQKKVMEEYFPKEQ